MSTPDSPEPQPVPDTVDNPFGTSGDFKPINNESPFSRPQPVPNVPPSRPFSSYKNPFLNSSPSPGKSQKKRRSFNKLARNFAEIEYVNPFNNEIEETTRLFEGTVYEVNNYYANLVGTFGERYQTARTKDEAASLAQVDLRAMRDADIDRLAAVFERELDTYEEAVDLVEDLKRNVRLISEADPKNVQEVAAGQLFLIDSYHKEVLTQANRSFTWAIRAGIAGFAFFIAAVWFLLQKQPTELASVSLIAGALVEVLSGINFYLYNQTAKQFGAFHERLDRTQNFLLANSFCENMSGDEQQKSRGELIRLITRGWKPATEAGETQAT